MRTRSIVTLVVVSLWSVGAVAQTPATSLAGTWKSKPNERPLNSEFDRSVWGPNAVSVRVVELVIRPPGDGTLTVTTRVLDARKRPVPGSTAIEAVKLSVGGPQEKVGARTDHAVNVMSAERRYPDDPGHPWPLDGLRVRLTTLDDAPASIDMRFDTPEGRGSFWETLERQTAQPRRSPQEGQR